jgi:hypothetical protein
VDSVETGELRGLLGALLRARAFEGLCRELPGIPSYPPGDPRRISPAVPAAFALRRRTDGTGDVFSLRRGSPAAALLHDLDARTLFRQALARAGAASGGRDPGGFPTDLARGLLGPVPSPGTLVEVMAGIAMAFRLLGEDRVALLVDDARGGASGFWHEGLNLAAVNRAPLVLVIDATEPETSPRPGPGFRAKAPAYGIDVRPAPAEDPVALLEALYDAVGAAREGRGVQLVEVLGGTDEEEWIATLTGRLRWAEAVTDGEVDGWMDAAASEMENALAAVLAEPAPDPAEARAPVHWGGPPAMPVWSPPS